MTAQEFTLEVPQPWVLNSNDRRHRQEEARCTRNIIQLTQAAARGLVPVERATVYVGIVKPTRADYDAGNLYPTAKALVDGIVRMGVLPDDTNDRVMGPWLYARGVDKRLTARKPRPSRIRLHVRLDEYAEIEF